MIDSMGAVARRLVRTRFAALLVCAGGFLLAAPASGLAANWSPTTETVPGSNNAVSIASGLDPSLNLTAVWDVPAVGIETNARGASTTAWGSASTIAANPGATSPDVAVGGNGIAVATWISSDHNAYVAVHSAGTWGVPVPLSSSGDANSVQAAIVNGLPTAFWISGNTIQSETETTPGGLWGTASSPTATPDSTTLSDLRVALNATGSGAASWLSTDGTTFSVESAQISSSSWSVAATPLSTTATAASTVSVASDGSLSAIGWSEPGNGVQVAVSTGSGFAIESNATSASSTDSAPAVAVDSNGHVFASWISGTTAQGEIRTGANAWQAPTTVTSDSPLELNLSSDASGDVAATWTTSAGAEMRVYDATPPTVTIVSPSSPASPGIHSWSVTTSDIWSSENSSTNWTFSDGSTPTGSSVQDSEFVPGTVTANVVETDGAGNTTAATPVTITISSVAPTNNSAPTINNGTSPIDGGTNLTVNAGSWSGNPTPVITEQWQRCAASGSPCVNEAAQSDGSYALTAADVGSRIRVEETATNDGGAPSIDSAQTPIVGPRAIGAPSLSAVTLVDRGLLTATSVASDWDGVATSGLNLIYHFQHCNGTSCTDVQATGSNTYVMQPADVGLQMQVSVVAKAGPAGGPFSATATSTSSQTSPVSPKATAAPTLSGAPQDTQVLTASSPPASWDGVSLLDLTYQFTRCDSTGANCATGVQNTSSSTYALKPADIGSTIRVTVSASKGGSDPTPSSPSAVSAVITPFNLGAPGTPTGTLKDGATLQASTGSWADQSVPGLLSFQYQWIGCSAALGCVPLGAASGTSTYNLQPTDVGTTIEVAVSAYATALPGVGLATVTTGATAPIAPLNTGPSTITPPAQPRDGQPFSASIGSWHGATGLSIGYQWQRCNQLGANCQPISGATNATYQAKAADVGSTLIVDVSASKNSSAITAAADSSQTDVIAPASTGLPALTGAPQDTQLITAASPAGDWDNVSGLTQTYQFFRCDSTGANCASSPIQSGQSATYTLSAADIGSTIRVVALAAKNGSSTTPSGNSPQTSIITPLLLGAAATPSGTTRDGSTLTASAGTWADQGQLNFNYQWFQCSPTCSSLGAASTSSTYVLKPTDVGNTIEAVVTAFIGAGAASTTSSQTFAIAPLNTGASVISAPTAQDGQLFTASDGGWDNATGLQFTYQWKRCDATGSSCAAISATTKSYTSVAADVGQTLKATVTASKGTSATTPSADSAPSAIVAPRNTTVPTIAGNPMDGQILTTSASTAASWDNPPATLTFSYQWLRCDATGNTCTPISGATATSYTLTPDDVASASDSTHAREQVRVQVTAAVGAASTASNSGASGIIAAIPTQLTQQPQIFGGSYDNVQLSVQPGMYNGTGIVYTNYQWMRCDPPLVNPVCTNVGTSGPNATTYAVTSADVGHYVTVTETVVNRLGVATTSRAAFGGQPVLENPFSGDAQPVVSGNYIDGGTLSTTPGTWSPSDPSTVYTYEWEGCVQVADYPNCPPLHNATASTYTLTSNDVGLYVVSRVHASYTPSGGVLLSADDWSDINLATQVAAAPPVSSGVPAITGNPTQGSTLTSSTGTWTGTNTTAVPITYTYQWLSCDSTGANCQPIPGATQSTYVPTGQDIGARLVVRVLAKNSGGAADAISTPTAAVAGLPASSSGGGGATVNADPGTGDSAGAGGTVHAQSGTGDKTLPRLTLVFLGGGTLSGGTTLQLDATCPKTEKSCKATFKLLATLKKPTGKAVAKPVTVASMVATLGSGQKKLLKLKLSAAARAILRSKRKLAVTLNVSIVDAAGNITPKQTKGITLRWKKG
jgi:hypothetical protein